MADPSNTVEASSERKAEILVRDDAPKLLAALRGMKDGLDLVRGKVEALTRKENQLPTANGIGYLEAKNHLLLGYCPYIVYYLLRKAKDLSVDGHPVVRSLIEIRLFVEKICLIDKKVEYQIQKLTTSADGAAAQDGTEHRGEGEGRAFQWDIGGIYHPPKFMPASMDDEDKRHKQASRRDRALTRMATENPYIKEIIDAAADRPLEWKETVGDENKEFMRYKRQREQQEKQEEELFTRAPITKRDKQIEKHMMRQMHGLRGLADDFDLGTNFDGNKQDDGCSSKPYAKSEKRKTHQKNKKRKIH